MRKITLASRGVTLIDDCDYDRVSKLVWLMNSGGYAASPIRNGRRSVGCIYLHRFIMGATDGIVDHINRNKLDNRRENLRFATKSQNALNAGRPADNTSGHRGVGFDKKTNKWVARIKVSKRLYFLGKFDDKLDAVRARALAELRFKNYIRPTVSAVVASTDMGA